MPNSNNMSYYHQRTAKFIQCDQYKREIKNLQYVIDWFIASGYGVGGKPFPRFIFNIKNMIRRRKNGLEKLG
jgi:hypothetical protein